MMNSALPVPAGPPAELSSPGAHWTITTTTGLVERATQ